MEQEDPLIRLRLGEHGFTGLKQFDGSIYEEELKELRFPKSLKVYKQMSNDPTIAAALSLTEMMISQVDWEVDTGYKPDDVMKARGKFLTECIDDMEHTWRDFIKEVCSIYTYGFCINEKVYRKRLHTAGSKFNDGKIGLKKLPVRSQDTISEWIFSEDGRVLTGVKQDLSMVSNGVRYKNVIKDATNEIDIPRKKFLLFRIDAKRDNPEGCSPLRAAWMAWRYRKRAEEIEAVGMSRDMNGTPVLYLPPKFMSEDATASEKRNYASFQNMLRNMQNNEQSCFLLPKVVDPESKQDLFKFELLSTTGGKSYNSNEIIQRWDNKILMCLFADMLKLGQDSVGSYALAGAKQNTMSMAIESRLKEIQDVLNKDLVPQLFELNGVPRSEQLPKLVYKNVDRIDLETFSKAVQRIFAVGGVELDRGVLNAVRDAMGFTPRDEDEDIDWDNMTNNQSRSGDGMAKGSGNGTSDNVAGKDNSVSNQENP